MTSKVIYKGELRTVATHLASRQDIITDAPTDNRGKGEAFSPTDLAATSLASCMMTIMGIKANDHGWNIDGTEAEVTKVMVSGPRRISKIEIDIHVQSTNLNHANKAILEKAARTCPVAMSLHPDIEQVIHFHW